MPADPEYALKITLFGSFEARLNGQPLADLRYRNGQWLLAFLTLQQGAMVERQRVAEALWPDHESSLQNPRDSLRQTVQAVRQALGDQRDLLTSTRNTLGLKADQLWVDVYAFDEAIRRGDPASLERAVALYCGPLLHDYHEPWILDYREERRKVWMRALLTLTAAAKAQHEYRRAEPHLRRAVALHPEQESLHRELMQVLIRCEDYAAVIPIYHELRESLWANLKITPEPATTALYHEALDIARARGAAKPLAPAAPSPATGAIPRSPNAFVGRKEEVKEVASLVLAQPLVTLTGAGGVGKTRLALEVMRTVADDFHDGVWCAELAAGSDPAHIAQAIASALGVNSEPGCSLTDSLLHLLRHKRLLLALDNCEHLLTTCTDLAQTLLRECPYLHLLATSRQPLDLAQETVWRVPSLSLPEEDPALTVQRLNQSDAAQLFVARATAKDQRFAVTDRNALSISRICRQLDGIPLALEMAAARIRSLTVEEIAARLDDRFHLLTCGSSGTLPRHQTLRAAIDWSYARLDAREQTLLYRLSVFRGGWTLEAAETVCGGGESDEIQNPKSKIQKDEVLDLLDALVNRSLVIAEPHEGMMRYRLLETVREYARERLLESGESPAMQQRHRDYFLALAEALAPRLNGSQQKACLDRLEVDHANLRAALEWCGEDVSEPGWRLRIALSRYWEIREYHVEGMSYLNELLQHQGGQHREGVSPLLLAQTLYAAGRLAQRKGDFDIALERLDQSLKLFREAGDFRNVAYALMFSGMIQMYQDSISDGLRRYRASRRLFVRLKERRGLADVLDLLGYVQLRAKDIEGAAKLFTESIAIYRALDDKDRIAHVLIGLANAVRMQGDRICARAMLTEALGLFALIGSRIGVAVTLANLAGTSGGANALRAAYSVLERSLEIYRAVGDDYHSVQNLDRLAQLDCVRGHYDLARVRLDDAVQRCKERPGRQIEMLRFAQGKLALHLCDFVHAWTLTRQVLQDLTAGRHNPHYPMVRIQLGVIAFHRGDDAQAEESFVTALEYCHNVANAEETVDAHNGLGRLACRQGNDEKACTHFRASLDTLQKLDDWMRTAVCLEGLAEAMHGLNHPEHAAKLLGAASALRTAVGAPLPPCDQPGHDRLIAALHQTLGSDFDACIEVWNAGTTLDLATVIEETVAITKA